MFEEYIVNDYVRALVIFVCLSIIFRVVLFVGEKVFTKATSMTKTDLDDILLKRLANPLTYLSVFVSLAISVRVLTLNDTVSYVTNNIIYSLIILVVARIIFLFVNILVFNLLKRATKKSKVKFDDSLFGMFSSLINATIIVLSILYVLSIWGVEIGPFLAGLGIAGLAVALALQPILSNIFSGAAIVLDESIKVGDVIYLEGESIKGRIDKIGLRATRVRTFDNEYVIVPNNKIAESPIQNIGLPEPKSRVVIPFGVAYGSDINKVKKLVEKELKKVKNRDKESSISVRFLEMADSSLNFKAYFYVESYSYRLGAKDEANTLIYNALNKAGIEIPFPQMDVHMKK